MAHDIGIIGGGVIGSAIARRLSEKYPHKNIVVFERLDDVGLETSKRNSGVIHSGLHQAPGSFRADFARKGSVMAIKYLQSKNLPMLQTGMLIVVPRGSIVGGLWREGPSLYHLIKRGRAQGIKFDFLTPWGVERLEPNIKALIGIFIPNVYVVDPTSFVKALYNDARDAGVKFLFNSRVIKIRVTNNSYCITTPNAEVEVKMLINAAGLYADEIAELAGVPGYKIYPWRGEYYEVCREKRDIVSRLVYPAAPINSPGRGIHFSPRVDGGLFIGPNARPVPRKDYYDEDKTPKEKFLEAVRPFCPSLEAKDLTWAYSGIRPKLSNASEKDFVFSLDRISPPLINIIGIESPGLSAAMAIAEHVSGMCDF